MRRLRSSIASRWAWGCAAALGLAACAGPETRGVVGGPPPGTAAVNQLLVSGNACGPAALLNSYRFGSPEWQRAPTIILGETDRGRLNTVIRAWGLRPSASLPGRTRWTRHGINAEDLRDVANEINRHAGLPPLACESFLSKRGETPHQLLARFHARLNRSLANGFPPVVSIRRLALRQQPGQAAEWVVVQGHFVTLTSATRKLPHDAEGFVAGYIDPWQARHAEGRVAISERAFVTTPGAVSPCLETDFPGTDAGLKDVRKGESTVLTLATAIGRW